ncbi:hypothetical protein C8Q77DRAFT_654571 [Trametes polyzona]|nr:hypothetical protein C8Q77DRAFT_654571 [Trametes polyzona]
MMSVPKTTLFLFSYPCVLFHIVLVCPRTVLRATSCIQQYIHHLRVRPGYFRVRPALYLERWITRHTGGLQSCDSGHALRYKCNVLRTCKPTDDSNRWASGET